MVYVLTKENKPLMPTNRHGHIRRLLKAGKAKVVRRMPFTIKLLYETPEIVQELTLGVDTGSSVIGNAVSTNDGKIVYTSKVIIRNDIKEKLTDIMKMVAPAGDVALDNLTEESSLSTDIGLSSVGVLYIVIAIEEFFDIRFDDVAFADFKTIGDVVNYIEKKVQ